MPDDRRQHILDGDERVRGRHGPGRLSPGKSTFPADWSDDQAIEAITDVANDPASTQIPTGRGRTQINGTRNGIDIEVIVGGDGKSIVTAYPTNVPRGSN